MHTLPPAPNLFHGSPGPPGQSPHPMPASYAQAASPLFPALGSAEPPARTPLSSVRHQAPTPPLPGRGPDAPFPRFLHSPSPTLSGSPAGPAHQAGGDHKHRETKVPAIHLPWFSSPSRPSTWGDPLSRHAEADDRGGDTMDGGDRGRVKKVGRSCPLLLLALVSEAIRTCPAFSGEGCQVKVGEEIPGSLSTLGAGVSTPG